jgi:hypothetical protein
MKKLHFTLLGATMLCATSLEFQNEVQHPRLDMISGRLEEPEECCSGNIPSFEL